MDDQRVAALEQLWDRVHEFLYASVEKVQGPYVPAALKLEYAAMLEAYLSAAPFRQGIAVVARAERLLS